MKYHYLRRYKLDGGITVDMGIVDVPEAAVFETLRLNPLWEDLGEVGVKLEEMVMPDNMECPLCGFKAKNEKSLRMHKMKAHKL